MIIKIVDGIEPAKELSDTVVIIDVFRASNTIISALARGITRIYVASDKNQADKLREKIQKSLYFGEQTGDKLPEADYNNSPSDIYNLDLHGKTAVLLTTMGSKAITAPANAKEIFIASFGNARTIAEYLKRSHSRNINFVACGEIGDKRALEDYECAKYIAYLIQDKPINFEMVRETILNQSNGAKRLKNKGQINDLEFCIKLDYSQIIPYVIHQDNDVIIQAK